MSLSKPTEREECVDYLTLNNDSNNNTGSSCFITDPIHGEIEVPVVCQAFLHSLEFDRLRSLKQLGCSHYVFPGAKHCRLEHSLGVMHLAGQFLQHLMLKRPGCASKEDRLCVMLAGLLHDLGHGPFSHLWEWFVAEARPEAKWNHESTSLQLIDHIIKENNLLPVLKEHGLTAQDVIFIKELICGPLQKNQKRDIGWPYEGRGPEKYFLYEFIANKISSVDVDKWDYLMRDAAAMDVKILFNYKKYINNSDITMVEGKMRLCIRDKQKENLGYLFQDRARLHKNYYQENTVKVVDRMVMDVFLLADPYLDILGRDNAARLIRISEACNSIETFLKLSDDFLIKTIQNSSQPELEPARALMRRICSRNFYKLLGEVPISGTTMDAQTCKRQINDIMKESRNAIIKEEDIIVCRKKIGSLGDQNMQEKVIFVDKDNVLLRCPVAEVMKTAPCFETLLVMCKRDQMEALAIEEAKYIFKNWSVKFKAELTQKATKET